MIQRREGNHMAQFRFEWNLQEDGPMDGNSETNDGLSVCECSQSNTLADLQLQYKCTGWGSFSHVLHHLV